MSRHVIAYDVADDGRRARLAKLLQRHGRRVQRSVFEVWLTPERLPALRREVGSLLGADDALDIYPLDERPGRIRLRWRRPLERWEPVVTVGGIP